MRPTVTSTRIEDTTNTSMPLAGVPCEDISTTVPGSLRIDTLEAVRLPKLYIVVQKCRALQPVVVSTPCFRLLVSA